MIRALLFHILLLMTCVPSLASHTNDTYAVENNKTLLHSLDSLILLDNHFINSKEKRIRQLRQQSKTAATPREQYTINQALYQEYRTYNADSAIYYAGQNLQIASKYQNPEEQAASRIDMSFAYTVNGLLTEALNIIRDIHPEELPRNLRSQYFGQMSTLYSRWRDYSSENPKSFAYYNDLQKAYQDSVFHTATPNEARYWNCRVWRYLGTPEIEPIRNVLESHKQLYQPDNRRYAILTYNLAIIYQTEKDESRYLENLILSAMADIRSVNGDAGSLQSIAEYLFNHGDINRAYTYITYCAQKAMNFHNRVRVIKISELQNRIHQAYLENNRKLQKQLKYSVLTVSLLVLVLLYTLFLIKKQLKRLRFANRQLDQANQSQQSNMQRLQEAYQQLENANRKLSELNEELAKVNTQLQDANYIKEEYIGYVFSLCSIYINQMETYNKNLNRKLKVGQVEEIKKIVNSNTMTNKAMREFYASFDSVFLRLYPTFVEDFNALLRPEEQIKVKAGELNTELRIHALIRLGITDSNKIAEFLHSSLQTIYNNRSRTCNKSRIPKEQFIQAVKELGKAHSSLPAPQGALTDTL